MSTEPDAAGLTSNPIAGRAAKPERSQKNLDAQGTASVPKTSGIERGLLNVRCSPSFPHLQPSRAAFEV
jgi:hypothetical protein